MEGGMVDLECKTDIDAGALHADQDADLANDRNRFRVAFWGTFAIALVVAPLFLALRARRL